MNDTLPIYETFYSWQGEGLYMGQAAYFIRTFGCPVQCPWCDSAGTWHPDFKPKKINRVSCQDLAQLAKNTLCNFAVITGGEPAIHDLNALTKALHAYSISVHLETSGAFPIKGAIDWITLSPKTYKLPLEENLQKAHEFKLIIDTPSAIDYWLNIVMDYPKPTWLHPEWSQRNNPEVLNAITTAVKKYGKTLRVGYQLHKLFHADLLDPLANTEKIPLGGNPQLGY